MKLFRIRYPFIEYTVGNRHDTTDVIANVKKNPNFERPLITIQNVLMPKNLYYLASITLSLHDKKTFGRKPLIGIAEITNFAKYIHFNSPKEVNFKVIKKLFN